MKKKILGLAIVVAVAATGAVMADVVIGGDAVWGPFACTTCNVSSPMPDAATRAYMDAWKQWQRDNVYFNFKYAPGDTIVVCNATHCTTYEVTATGGYLGKERVSITPPPLPNGGGGGTSGGGDGSGGGTWGVIGYNPVYTSGTVCSGGNCHSEMILVGWTAIMGWIPRPGGDTRSEK